MPKTEDFAVTGIHCASCANIISRTVSKLPGVNSANVNIATNKLRLSYDPNLVNVSTINTSLSPFGYHLNIHKHRNQTSFPKIFVASLFVFILMIIGFFLPLPMMILNPLYLLLASAALLIYGRQFLSAIPIFVRRGKANMDTLIGIGTLTAYIYSLYNFIAEKQADYFETVIVIIGFILFGKYLEDRSKAKTGEAISKLIKLQAKTALVKRSGQEIEVPIDQVAIGDIVIIKPGSKIPVDGIITSGFSSIDESMISGESLPVDKTIGDTVISGTINHQGVLEIKATKIGSDTVLAHIIKMVEDAQGSKAPIEKIADQVSAIFVPTVLVIAVLSFAVWLLLGNISLAISAFVGILVIACPCALGLATPTGIIVGVGKGAENGILIKDAESLEKLHSIDTIVMDKTGTLTKGRPNLVDIITQKETDTDKILGLLASLEKNSEHPLAKAVVNKAKAKNIKLPSVTDFSILEGKGLTGKINGNKYYAGNLRLVTELKIEFDPSILTPHTALGHTPILLTDTKSVLGIILIADTTKDEAIDSIKALHALGIQVIMLTGDHQNTAEHIAKQIGIDQVIAEVLPHQKMEKIQSLKNSGKKVAMIGDGVNDAPALALADVGIAMGSGTDIAIESANITLLHGDLTKLVKAIKLSKATMKTIKQNLFWAFIYNVIGIPIAAGVLYPLTGILLNPVFAGAAMAFSSVSVVSNSLRLKSIKL